MRTRYYQPPHPGLEPECYCHDDAVCAIHSEEGWDHDRTAREITDEVYAAAARPTPAEARAVAFCDHVGTDRVTRTAHGYLGDAPAGTIEILCGACGAEVER